MKKIYCISGIGADHRIFQFLSVPNYELIHLPWLKPIIDESLISYARRLSEGIVEEEFILLGVSFGGMLATEIARLHSRARVIIISSAGRKKEIPFYLRIFRYLPIYKVLPDSWMHRPNKLLNYFIGAHSPAVQDVVKKIMLDTDSKFIRWALGTILCWPDNTKPSNLFQIHGSADFILPNMFVNAHYTLNKGTHLMVMEQATALQEAIRDYLRTETDKFNK